MTLRPESDIAANWMKLAADLEARNLAQRMEIERLRAALELMAEKAGTAPYGYPEIRRIARQALKGPTDE